MKKRLGFSLIELVIAVALIAILSTAGALSFAKRNEKNALIKMETAIPTFFENVCQNSLESGEKFEINCDLSDKKVEIKDLVSGNTLKKLTLSKELSYVFINSNEELTGEVNRKTTSTGNINKGFTIYVFNNKGKALEKISLNTTTEAIQYIKINVTKPAKDMYLNNLSYGRKLTDKEDEIVNYKNWN